MPAESLARSQPTFHPLTPDRWQDLETLFGERGAYGGCWCMWWRVSRSQFERQGNAGNKRALKALVDTGPPPGILAYADDHPIGWCSVGPRESYPALERSRVLKRIDDQPVWSIVCFFVARSFRRQGLLEPLLNAAIAYARAHGATIVEGYPVEPHGALSSAAAFTGIAATFRNVGFVEVARRSPTRPMMRYFIDPRHDPTFQP